MAVIDVFNGDADGLCALHQIRLADPCESLLVTGVKRDIALLNRVDAKAGDQVTVLDVSLDKNRDALNRLLEKHVSIQYFDHHFAGELPVSECFDAHINTSADVCTSLLVNDYLNGAYLAWAVVAAFGDNLFDAAIVASKPLQLSEQQLYQLQHLGTLLNYNGYGVTLDDLYFAPDDLYRELSAFEDPFAFMASSKAYKVLDQGYSSDMEQVKNLPSEIEEEKISVLLLPDEAWTRRVSGVFANELARSHPDRAHALITSLPDNAYRISVRAPLNNKSGADELCMQFPTGGGRKAAAGINHLPASMFGSFVDAFRESYS
ncbi:MAG: DHH family phosphoesterase [Mariprofundus sp.]|nr:DHH family phosphoesterase [Mariprofundus sp.]